MEDKEEDPQDPHVILFLELSLLFPSKWILHQVSAFSTVRHDQIKVLVRGKPALTFDRSLELLNRAFKNAAREIRPSVGVRSVLPLQRDFLSAFRWIVSSSDRLPQLKGASFQNPFKYPPVSKYVSPIRSFIC